MVELAGVQENNSRELTRTELESNYSSSKKMYVCRCNNDKD